MTERKEPTRGFGFRESASNGYHFELKVDSSGGVTLIERFATKKRDEPLYHTSRREKCELSPRRWDAVKDAVANEFNRRLKQDGISAGRWLKSSTPLAPAFGKELAVLMWAIDDQDILQIPRMLANWRGLAPEERWWFYTTINAGYKPTVHKPTTGWQAAIKVAFLADPADLGLDAVRLTPDPKPKEPDADSGIRQGKLFAEPNSPDYDS